MKRTAACTLFALLLLLAPPLPAEDQPTRPARLADGSRERAAAVDLNHSGRDAIIFRAEQGDGLAIFMPEPEGGWSRRLYPNLGPEVTAFAAGDLNGDGDTDLVVATADGMVSTWLGDGTGQFIRRSRVDAGTGRVVDDLVIGEFSGDGRPDVALHLLADELRLLPGDGWGEIAVGAESSMRSWEESAIRFAFYKTHERATNYLCDAALSRVSGEHDEYLPRENEIRTRDCATGRVSSILRPYFSARLLAYGDFNGDGRRDIAAVSGGVRPELQIFESRDAAPTPASSAPSFHSFRPAIPNTTWNVTIGPGAVFNPATTNAIVGDTVSWTGLAAFHTVTSINTLCTEGCNGKFCSPASASSFSKVFNLVSEASAYKCSPHCGVGMRGTVNVTAPSTPGTIPDGQTVPGTPLRLSKSGATNLALTWGASCSATATASVVYEGAIGTYYSHTSMPSAGCATAGTAATVIPAAGSRYYLIVARNASNEGSYGRDSGGGEIPPAAVGACLPQNLAGSC